jgi:hypothetical protein
MLGGSPAGHFYVTGYCIEGAQFNVVCASSAEESLKD